MRWVEVTLNVARLHCVLLGRFALLLTLTVEMLMAASDEGLCTLSPSHKQFTQVRYCRLELEQLAINPRELMSAFFAAMMWGSLCASVQGGPEKQVCFRINNTIAIAGNNKRFRTLYAVACRGCAQPFCDDIAHFRSEERRG